MRRSTFVLMLWAAAALHHPASAGAACSSYMGEATLNEVYRLGGTRFVEVKLIDSGIGASVYDTWSLTVCDSTGCSTYNLSTATVNGPYLVIDNVENIDLRAGATMDAVLHDGPNGTGDTIDYVSVNGAPYQNPPASCAPASLPYPYSYTNTASEKKGIYRNPDGTGSWSELEDSGGSGEPTEGGDNSTSSLGSFNAYDTTTAAGAIIGDITTRTSGSQLTIDIVAIKNQAIDTNYKKTVTVELVNSNTGGSCESLATLPISSQSAAFTAGDNGRMSISFPAADIANVWRNVRVRMTEGNSTACSTDNFAIRPDDYIIQASHDDWENPGGNELLSDTNESGIIIHKAGRFFTLEATAVNAVGNVTTNYDGQPDEAVLTDCGASSACPATTGNLNTGTWSSAGGLASSSTATYSEVGSFGLVLRDRTFASVDADDTPDAQRYISSAVQPVGRFVPDHFLLTKDIDPIFLTFNDAACPTRSFTYIGQPFGYATAPVIGITARNATGGTTANYAGALWKILDEDNVSQTYAANSTLDTGLIGIPVIVSNNDGTGTITPNGADRIAFTRNGTVAPFNADISLSVSVTDDDGVTDSADALFDGVGGGIAFDSGNEFRFGRLVLHNAFGPEILPLTIPLRAEYYDGSAFVPNLSDSCTPYDAAADLSLNTFYPNLDSTDTSGNGVGTLVGGLHDPVNPMILATPGAGNDGSVDLSLGVSDWLRYDWDGVDQGSDGNLDDDDPTARATFGIYKGNPRVIYIREMY